jgi:hypothetical protein
MIRSCYVVLVGGEPTGSPAHLAEQRLRLPLLGGGSWTGTGLRDLI